MKKTIFTLSVLLLFSTTIICANDHMLAANDKAAQQENEQLHSQFLDPVFQSGHVIFKDGTGSEQNLNYHLNSNRICYINESGDAFVLVDLSTVKEVTYGNRTFIPTVKSEIAEVLKTYDDGSKLLLQREARLATDDDNRGPYGGSTITASLTRLSTMPEWGVFEPLAMDNIFKPDVKERFVLMKEGKRHKISRLKSLKKIYRKNWKKIETYAKENNSDFKSQQDLIDLFEIATQ
jgi:hypothetical protein